MARGTVIWARHQSKRSTTIVSSNKECSVRFSQFKNLSETLKFIMSPDVTSFDKLNLPNSTLEKRRLRRLVERFRTDSSQR
ncbi:hypothetical protein TNCV_1002171 [Trichonephila clavipes]|nr:hypothetical protein TNCV_1002171 [Trichonephila clavipes]